ncbi:helix-turn-helix domain-containing protein [Streptomyces stramineus]
MEGAKREAAARLIGAQLRILRQERGLGLKDVAPVIRGSVSKVSRWSAGRARPRNATSMTSCSSTEPAPSRSRTSKPCSTRRSTTSGGSSTATSLPISSSA